MNKRILFSLAYVMFFISGCRMESNDAYTRAVTRARYSKDSFLKGSNESPMDLKAKKELISLSYFEPDSGYKVKARLELFDNPKSFKMQVTNSPPDDYFELGYAIFSLDGHDCKLAVFQSAKYKNEPQVANQLFCPFTDETNGKETYGGGRFLDLER